jgi:hypothetical protein
MPVRGWQSRGGTRRIPQVFYRYNSFVYSGPVAGVASEPAIGIRPLGINRLVCDLSVPSHRVSQSLLPVGDLHPAKAG